MDSLTHVVAKVAAVPLLNLYSYICGHERHLLLLPVHFSQKIHQIGKGFQEKKKGFHI